MQVHQAPKVGSEAGGTGTNESLGVRARHQPGTMCSACHFSSAEG